MTNPILLKCEKFLNISGRKIIVILTALKFSKIRNFWDWKIIAKPMLLKSEKTLNTLGQKIIVILIVLKISKIHNFGDGKIIAKPILRKFLTFQVEKLSLFW